MEKDQLIETFLMSLKERPEIWNLKNPNHMSYLVVNQKWNEILTFLRESFPEDILLKNKYHNVDELKKRYRNFRACLSKEKKRVKGKDQPVNK